MDSRLTGTWEGIDETGERGTMVFGEQGNWTTRIANKNNKAVSILIRRLVYRD